MLSLKSRELGLEDTLSFGKHKGTKLRLVIGYDCTYVRWALDTGVFQLNEEAQRMYDWHMENRRSHASNKQEDGTAY